MNRCKLIDALPPFDVGQLKETTDKIIEAINCNQVALLKNRANYRTDRPANKNKAGCSHIRGNSESEVSFPFDLGLICDEVGISSPNLCVNSLRMYGQISDENPLHFHGYDDPDPVNDRMEFIIFTVKMISPYDPTTGAIYPLECSRYAYKWEKSPFVLIYEENGLVKYVEPEVGDMLVLPSGIFLDILPR